VTYIYTKSGNKIDLQDPDPSKINLPDIAWALGNICRFTGHCDQFYSVRDHSLTGTRHIEDEYKLEFLLHDAAEAYLGDVSSPLKSLLPEYQKIEARFDSVIRKKYGLPEVMSHRVKEMDIDLCFIEMFHMATTPVEGEPLYQRIKDYVGSPTLLIIDSTFDDFLIQFGKLK